MEPSKPDLKKEMETSHYERIQQHEKEKSVEENFKKSNAKGQKMRKMQVDFQREKKWSFLSKTGSMWLQPSSRSRL